MQQHAFVTVDVGDLALGGGGDAEAGIEGEDAVILVDRGDVDDIGAEGAGTDGELGLLAGAQVRELELLV